MCLVEFKKWLETNIFYSFSSILTDNDIEFAIIINCVPLVFFLRKREKRKRFFVISFRCHNSVIGDTHTHIKWDDAGYRM